MLHAAEVLAAVDPGDPYLDRFDLAAPRTEGDLVILLRTTGSGPASGEGFAAALPGFCERTSLRNPRTPLLWTLFHGVAIGRDEAELALLARELVAECSRFGDQRMYRAVVAVAAGRVAVPPLVQPDGSAQAADPLESERLLAGFSALGTALAEQDVYQRQRVRT